MPGMRRREVISLCSAAQRWHGRPSRQPTERTRGGVLVAGPTDASDPISVNGSSKCLLGNLVIPNDSAKNEWASRRSPVARLLDA